MKPGGVAVGVGVGAGHSLIEITVKLLSVPGSA